MAELPKPELAIFLSVVVVFVAAGIVGILQLRVNGDRYGRLLAPLISLGVALEAVLLIFRAATIKAVPLTGLFESMIVLTMVFGLIYLLLGIVVTAVWFGSTMVWLILGMTVLTAIAAEPSAQASAIAATPWAVAHGIAMVLGGACIAFAAVCAFLYLFGIGKLKRKEVMKVLGKVPNIERLERMNILAAGAGFVLLTLGIASGLGLTTLLKTGLVRWLTDVKVICTIAAWGLLGVILLLDHIGVLSNKTRTYVTVAAFVLVAFAILGAAVLGVTQHNFSV